jgi:hypothetical protein
MIPFNNHQIKIKKILPMSLKKLKMPPLKLILILINNITLALVLESKKYPINYATIKITLISFFNLINNHHH